VEQQGLSTARRRPELIKQGNPNRPKVGQSIKVEPIRDEKSIVAIKQLLATNPRDLALFIVGINTGLRPRDLCELTVRAARQALGKTGILVQKTRTGGTIMVRLNHNCWSAIRAHLEASTLTDSEPLFKTVQATRMTTSYLHELVNKWCRAINLRGNYGSRTLRKTFGYRRYKEGCALADIMVCFGHRSRKQTLDYLCIEDEQVGGVQ